MTLMRVFSRVDREGKIAIPSNIRQEAGLKEGKLVELKIIGTSKKKSVLVTVRESAR